ncbi:MAG TPA: stage II sporulation protein P [Clostridia bacterium]|nr:stage II sporulation protein P [Clostridia bacterium]
MERRYKYKGRNTLSNSIYKTVLFILLSAAAILTGINCGDLLSHTDTKIVRNTDTQNFKRVLNRSYPMIDTVYNSGHVSASFTEELKSIVKKIFGFSIDEPATILNAQSASMNSYYKTDYEKYLASQENTDFKLDYSQIGGNDTSVKDPVKFLTDASSISTEEGSEENDNDQGQVIQSSKIEIVNQTKYKIDIDSLLKSPLNIKFDRKGPKVLIFHTHTSESYVNRLNQRYDHKLRCYTMDSRYNVIRVGEEIKKSLESYGISTIHNGTIHNYPDQNKAYGKSQATVSKILKSYPSIKVVIDIHRDGLVQEKPKLRVVSKIKGKPAAKVMFVMGSDKPSLRHPNWQENLKLAIKIQDRLNKDYPGLARPILISRNRYNQNLSNGAILIEVGGDGNLLDECLVSAKCIAKAIDEVIGGLPK